MKKKKATEDEHEPLPHAVVIDKGTMPSKKDGPHPATVAAPGSHAPIVVMPRAGAEGSIDQARKTGELQRGVGNTRVGRILAAHDHAENHSVRQEVSESEKRVSPIQLEQEKGKGHV
jgi:hypothetical protein